MQCALPSHPPLRSHVSRRLLQDLERTWDWEAPIDCVNEGGATQRRALSIKSAKALDYLLLDVLKPLRPILSSFDITLDLATLFEAHCQSMVRR